jgi:hypothetical protein
MDTMILQCIHENIGINHFNKILADKNMDLEILLSWVNVFEKIRGSTEEYHFIKNRDIIKMALNDLNVCLLANPDAHIKMQFDKGRWETHGQFLKTLLFDFRDANNLSEFMHKWHDWISKSNADLERIKKEYDDMAQQVAALPKKAKGASNEGIYDSLKAHLIEKFSLPQEYVESNSEVLYNDFPSIRYYAELFIDFAIGIGNSTYRKDVGNYLDNAQVLYLNIVDYFITNDKGLVSRMRNLKSGALIERVFTLNEFIELGNSQINRRAPQEVSDYYEF